MDKYKELSKQLRYCGDEGKCQSCEFYRVTEPCSQNLLSEAADAIEELLKASKKPNNWIPVSERPPDEDYWTGTDFQSSANVLMTVSNADDDETNIDYGHTIDGEWYSDTNDCFVPPEWKVLAWMPLPEPYKGCEKDG